jgi:hypothetical protein
MKSRFSLSGVLSSSFHDIDLSGSGPSSVNRVSGHHPDGGPEIISLGDLGSDLESSVFPCGSVFGVDSSRSILLVGIVFGSGGDVESSVFHLDVGVSIGVALQFVVSSSVAIDFVLPLGGIKRISIEFVLPDELVLCGGEKGEGEENCRFENCRFHLRTFNFDAKKFVQKG